MTNDEQVGETAVAVTEAIGRAVGALRDAAAYLAPNGGYTRMSMQTEGGQGAKSWAVTLTYVDGTERPFTAHGQTLPAAIAAMRDRLEQTLREREDQQRRQAEQVRACLKRATL